MKRGFSAILTIVLLLTVSCGRNKGMFILQGTVLDGTDTIVVVGFDSRFDRTDTIFPQNGQFTWSFRPDTVTTLLLLLPDGRHYPVFAQKDVQSQAVIPADTGLYRISGGYCNDSYDSFFMSTLNDSTLGQSVTAIDSFITKDPFSEVTPYLIYDRLVLRHHADQKTLDKVIKRMSGNMQDAPYLTALKTEFKGDLPSNSYISSLTLMDSTGTKKQFADMGGSANYLLVCIWTSWVGDKGVQARKSLDSLITKYSKRKLAVIDISVDVNMDRWKQAITKDTVKWDSYIDTDGWESRIIRGSNTRQIPAYVLFSSVKRVTYSTQSFSDIDKELDRVLPKHEPEPDSKRALIRNIKR